MEILVRLTLFAWSLEEVARALVATLRPPRAGNVPTAWETAKLAVRFLSQHTGVPALLVAALLVVLSYRVLRRTARFFVEVAAIAATLLLASELGWIRW